MPTLPNNVVVHFERDTTIRWSCRAGDFILWIAPVSPLLRPDEITIADFWEMKDGDFVTITNRLVDLPSWFKLTPEEVAGDAALSYLKMPEYHASERVEVPIIWRALTGNRLVWAGTDVGGRRSYEGVVQIADLRCNALVAGETWRGGSELMDFGAPSQDLGEAPLRLCQSAVRVVRRLHCPDEFSERWLFGV